jgi:hypothetical protein
MKLNCWEFHRCGRELGGEKIYDLGICPASTETRLDGIHDGISAGRACWVAAGTMCKGRPTGSFARKISSCEECSFYRSVMKEEGKMFLPHKNLFFKASPEKKPQGLTGGY